MVKLYFLTFALIFLIPLGVFAQGSDQKWYFPIQGFESRNQYKTFNQYWDKSAYKGKEALFPTQYTGYHVADDLEINKSEENQNVSVYAVTDGKITFAGPVGGYGGLILLNIANDSHTALYGHIKLSSLKVKAGDSVKAGQELAYLGNAFSSETGGERKHLHFGIYNGKGVYYHGYESSESTVKSKWVDPAAYLKSKGAMDISSQKTSVSDNQSSAANNQNVAVDNGSTNVNINTNDNVASTDIPATQADQNLSNQVNNKGLIETILNYLGSMFSKIRSVL